MGDSSGKGGDGMVVDKEGPIIPRLTAYRGHHNNGEIRNDKDVAESSLAINSNDGGKGGSHELENLGEFEDRSVLTVIDPKRRRVTNWLNEELGSKLTDDGLGPYQTLAAASRARVTENTPSAGLEFMDEEALYDMPNLLMNMAQGMLVSRPRMKSLPPNDSPDNYYDGESLWSYP
ncbi:hypothetical protein LguiA_010195 [Lonicera macranthoides]